MVVRCIIESSEKLVWSERTNVVVRVSGKSEEAWSRQKVPRMVLAYGFIDLVLILTSLKTIMGHVVSQALEQKSNGSVQEMIFERVPS